MNAGNLYKELYLRIQELRKREDWSQDDLARAWGISRSAVSQVENGERSVSSSELKKLTEVFSVTADYLLGLEDEPEVVLKKRKTKPKVKNEIRISVPQAKIDKFKQVLLYLLERCGGKPNVGETVLYKLLYFADFNYYEQFEEQLTGATYRKLQYGPVPIEFNEIMKDMIADGEIRAIEDSYYDYRQKRYIPLAKADSSKLLASEKEILDDVISRLSDKSATWLSEYSHEDVPWKATDPKDVIDYELVFYRTTAYSVRDYHNEDDD